jgi:hypothetical protein
MDDKRDIYRCTSTIIEFWSLAYLRRLMVVIEVIPHPFMIKTLA